MSLHPGRAAPRRRPSRAWYLALVAGTILLGLAVHFGGRTLSPAPRDVPGDALWAVMMTWWVAAAVPAAGIRARAAAALAICFAVEASQLYHAPWIDALRGTTPGHLVLGSDFDARDPAAYAAGVVAAAILERAVLTRRGAGSPPGGGMRPSRA